MINAQLRMHPERKINVLAYKDISDVIKGEKVLIGVRNYQYHEHYLSVST